MKNKIKLSILTSHFKDINGLIKTWNSIKSQTSDDWEWIIVDSFTEDFFSIIPKELLSNKKIKIYQIKSSIYDAMNFAILKTTTDYFHFLNCRSTYTSRKSLKEINAALNQIEKNQKFIHSFAMVIRTNLKKSYLQIPNNKLYPFLSGHESTIFPTIKNNKILIRSYKGIAADMIFMFEYSFYFKLKNHKIKFINYPKGGYSDSLIHQNDKLKGYFHILVISLLRFKIPVSIISIYKIISELKLKMIMFLERIKNG